MRSWSGNTDITLKANGCIPSVSFPQDSHLFDRKPTRDRSMQIDWDCPNLGQQEMLLRYWILFELGKEQRLKLPILLESGKAKPPLLEIFPPDMQLLNGLLKNLRRNFAQSREFFLGSWQVVKLLDFSRKFQIGREDVFFFKRASINQALPTIAPIFYLPQRIVVCTTTDIHPLNEHLLLNGIRIDSVAMGECQHSSIILDLQANKQALNVNLRESESLKLTAFHPP